MDTSTWGIGIVGLGGISRWHLEGYKLYGLKVVAGADIDEERFKFAREEFGIEDLYTDFRELIDRDDVRIVDITVPHKLEIRAPIVEYAAKKGRAIFIQKPLMSYLSEAKELVDIAKSYGAPMMVNQNSVFVPGFQAIEPYVRDELYIGTPYYCQIENRSWVDVSKDHWFAKGKRWIISDVAVHHLALVRHWFGDADTVYAVAAADASQKGVLAESLGVLNIKFKNGVVCVVINNWCFRGKDGRRPHSLEEIVIQGDRGCIRGTPEEICITTSEGTRIYPEIKGSWSPDAFGNGMRHYIEALDKGKPFLCEAEDNLKTVAIIEAAYRSIEGNCVVNVDDLLEEI